MLNFRVDPIERDIRVFVKDITDPKAISKMIAAAAEEALAEAIAINNQATGTEVPYETYVDGSKDAPLESVRPVGGRIEFEFDLAFDALAWIYNRLRDLSPVLYGHYKRSHRLYADGVEVNPLDPPAAFEYVFLDEVPYARKIERGLSKQAPEGVYQIVAAQAAKQFGKFARITFSYRAFTVQRGSNSRSRRDARQPAVIIRLR